MLVFVVITSMAMLFMMIEYAEHERAVAENVREIIKPEKALQAGFLCVGYISRTLARYPLLNEDLIFNIRNLKMQESSDTNHWIEGSQAQTQMGYNQGPYNCSVINFEICGTGACSYEATIEGNDYSKIYVEWTLDEYRFYISKLRLI